MSAGDDLLVFSVTDIKELVSIPVLQQVRGDAAPRAAFTGSKMLQLNTQVKVKWWGVGGWGGEGWGISGVPP